MAKQKQKLTRETRRAMPRTRDQHTQREAAYGPCEVTGTGKDGAITGLRVAYVDGRGHQCTTLVPLNHVQSLRYYG